MLKILAALFVLALHLSADATILVVPFKIQGLGIGPANGMGDIRVTFLGRNLVPFYTGFTVTEAELGRTLRLDSGDQFAGIVGLLTNGRSDDIEIWTQSFGSGSSEKMFLFAGQGGTEDLIGNKIEAIDLLVEPFANYTSDTTGTLSFTLNAVPEPTTLYLFLLGVGTLTIMKGRRKQPGKILRKGIPIQRLAGNTSQLFWTKVGWKM